MEDREFLAKYDASRFPHPSVAVDVALIMVEQARLRVMVVRRREPPHKGRWSLPGGFVGMDESLETAAHRLLQAKTGIDSPFLEQLYTFGRPKRDPRTRVITVAYYALISEPPAEHLKQRKDLKLAAVCVPWTGESGGVVTLQSDAGKPLKLAFDHAEILGLVVQRLRGKLYYAPIGFELLGERFTLRQLQTVHEAILDRKLKKSGFRRRMLASGLIAPTGDREEDVTHRPAELYRFTHPTGSHLGSHDKRSN